MPDMPRNGTKLRTLVVDGLTLSEVDFHVDEGFPRGIGYMVGEDDGRSVLHPTPEQAIAAHRGTP